MQIPIYCRKHGCTKPDPVIQMETSDTWAFVCRTCGLVQVVSKDHVKGRARYERELARLGKTVKHSWDKEKLWFS